MIRLILSGADGWIWQGRSSAAWTSSCAKRRCSRPAASCARPQRPRRRPDLAGGIGRGAWRRRPDARRHCRAPAAARAARHLRSRLGRSGGDRRHAARTRSPPSARATSASMSAAIPTIPATAAAAAAVARPTSRIRLVIGPAPGPTSKADCLNRLWRGMLEDEARGGRPGEGGGAPRRRGRGPFGRASACSTR